MKKFAEADVAAVVLTYMLEQGYDCYPEAECAGGRPDIVGVRPFPFAPHRKCVHIVETKTAWTLSLLEQAETRKRYANFVSIAAPTKPNHYFEKLCKREGIGMIRLVEYAGELRIDDYHKVPPRMIRFRKEDHDLGAGPHRVLAQLDDDMKRYRPGTTSDHGYSTAWRRTMDRAAAYVRTHPGCTVADLLAHVDHHYTRDAGARQGFVLWLPKRDDIEARTEGRKLRFYPPGAPSIEPALL